MVLFHHVNAYEEEDHVVFDIISYKDNSLYQMFYLKNLDGNFENNTKLNSIPTCKRFVIPLQYDKVRNSKLYLLVLIHIAMVNTASTSIRTESYVKAMQCKLTCCKMQTYM